MEHGITPISGNLTPRGAKTRPVAVPDLPAEPPASLGPEYHIAARVIEYLAARQVNLHFEIDEATNRLQVQMLDHDGQVIREIPAHSLLDSLSGGAGRPSCGPPSLYAPRRSQAST